MCHVASSKRGFVKLLNSRPEVVKYIRKLTYKVSNGIVFNNEDNLLSPILPNLLRTISRPICLIINGSKLDWNILSPPLTSAFLYLMHLPTINHIDLSFIHGFPLSSFTPSPNLLRFDILYLRPFDRFQFEEDGFSEIVIQSDLTSKIREFRTSGSVLLTTKLFHAKGQDGQPAFNFMDLRRLSPCFYDDWNLRYLLQNAKLLEKLHISVRRSQSLVGLHDILSYIGRTLKVLDLKVYLPLAGFCEELAAMAGHNTLEALFFEVDVNGNETEDFIGSIIQNVEKVLVKPGWPALRRVSFKVLIACCLVSRGYSAKLSEVLQSLPDKYLSRLSNLQSVAFSYSAYVVKCTFLLEPMT